MKLTHTDAADFLFSYGYLSVATPSWARPFETGFFFSITGIAWMAYKKRNQFDEQQALEAQHTPRDDR